MSAVYKSICNEADEQLLLVTRLADKEIKLKVDIERLMNEGFVNIAKARYIMGSTCVTKMQLPSEKSNPIQPLVTVYREQINNSWVFYISRKNDTKRKDEFPGENYFECPENSEYEFNKTCSSKTSLNSVAQSEAAFKNILQNDPKSLKTSKNAFLVENHLYQSYNDDLLDEMSNSGSKESLVSVTDPLRLFGILVPRALRQAQIIFNDVVNLLGRCATVQFELGEALRKFNYLMRVKGLIEAAAKKSEVDFLMPKVYWTPTTSSTVSCYSVESSERGEEGESRVSVQKSVRSVLYSAGDIEPLEETEFQLWGSGDGDDNNESDN